MNCECKRCSGSGMIEEICHACDGEGTFARCVSQVDLAAIGRLDGAELASLERLQADARRCRDQAAELTRRNPACAASYEMQLTATLGMLNAQADEVLMKL